MAMPYTGGMVLTSAVAVRAAAKAMLTVARQHGLDHFTLHEDRLPACVDAVIETTRLAYPDNEVPFHARWRHFCAAGRNLWAELEAAAGWPSPEARLRAAYDLAIVSVLLDAGAGADWHFRDPATGTNIGRSEGLGLASLAMFRAGAFSADPADPLRVDGAVLAHLSAEALAEGFQVSANNPMVGLEGRADVLRSLGRHLMAKGETGDAARPGRLADWALGLARAHGHVPAASLLLGVLGLTLPIAPDRSGAVAGAGDAWFYRNERVGSAAPAVVPFHKLSQWLAYSLIEPLQWHGVTVSSIDGLTGLPEYRNGGLFLDMGVLQLRDAAAAARPHDVGSPLVVEWRAMTVVLLDMVAAMMRQSLGVSAADLPLAKVLEGGTWATGRRIAREKRANGGPPLTIISDGTVF